MRLSDSRIVVLDVVASVASGMPVYYSIPDTMAAEAELAKTELLESRAPTGSLNPLKRLQTFVQTHLTTARKAITPPHQRRRRRAF